MDNKNSKDSSSRDGSKDATSRRSTREIGILCSVTKDLVSVNDKCIMVGTTGIAALKAKYGDDFTNFEIIQDVGYSSESSTHLSSDDVSDHIRIYSYSPVKRSYSCDVNSNISLSKGTDYSTVSNLKLFGHSSLGSNSSHNDSGFGALEAVVDAGEISPGVLDEQYLSSSPGANGDYYGESDLLDSVDFPNISEFENEHTDYGLDEMESSESLDNFQNRSSFTSSTRVFYKMTSVDSDYGDKGSQEKESLKAYSISSSEDEVGTERIETHMDNDLLDNGTGSNTSPVQNSLILSSENGSRLKSDSLAASNSDNELRSNDDHSSEQNVPNTDISSLSDIECLPVTHSKTSSDPQDSDISEEFLLRRRYANHLCSTPCVQHPSHHQKPQPKNHRKGRRRRLSFDGSHDSTNNNWDTLLCSCSKNKTTRSNRVREWLKRCSDGKSTSSAPRNAPAAPVPDESASDDHHHLSPLVVIETAVDSSCDASGEYTTTESDDESADYHAHSGSVMGSVETVVPLSITCFRGIPLTGNNDGELTELLPPPPPPTPPTSCEETSVGTYSYQLRKDGSFRKATRSISEGDLCMSGLKRSGMKHFNESRGALSGAKLSENPEFIVPCMSTNRQTSESRRNTRMWRRSLPIVLCSESGQSGSDVPSQYIKSSATLTSLGYSSDISQWQKSLSGSGRRSRKRSSSSSKCSSTKSSNFANRHHHHGSRTTISASRGRHLSQSSGPHYKETLFAFEESQTTKPIDEDVLQSISSHVEEDRPCIPRSPENDVILTQYEEQSTASDQVWDGYQEMPYLSEAYSEPTVDEDAVRKLTEFGDDYCSAIGSQSHGLGSSNRKRAETSAFPTKSLTHFAKTTTTCPPTLKSSNNTVDSDSDIEDLHDILTETCRALQFARNTLNCRREGRVLSQAENAELLATCQTHLRCLEVICEHIEIDGKEKNFSREDLERLHDLIEEWAELQRTVVMNQQEVQNCEEKVLKAQKNIDDLYTNMAELSSANHFNPKDISALSDLQEKMEAIQLGLHLSHHLWTLCNMAELSSANHFNPKDISALSDLQEKMEAIQMALSTLLETKAQLLAVNIQVHRIVTESGDTSSPLKQDITELYQQWEDAYEENGNQLTDLQLLYNKWQEYEKNYQKLISRLREEQKRLQSSCDTTLQTGEDDDDYTSFEDELEELHINAGFLECRLRGAVVWSKISDDLRQLHSEIQQLKRRQRHHSESVMEELRMSPTKSQSVHYSDAAFDDEVMDDVHQKEVEDARLKSEEDTSELPLEASDAEKPTTGSQSRLWRVFRAALPIQLALVFLYCLACALEPHCCDLLNNFNFSLSPQLRYVRGPPPV